MWMKGLKDLKAPGAQALYFTERKTRRQEGRTLPKAVQIWDKARTPFS